jgi:hypothetical protein
MSQDILCVLQTLRHFRICAFEGCCQRVAITLATFVDVCHNPGLAGQNDFGRVLKIDLHDLV